MSDELQLDFEKEFGQAQAEAIINAANEHKNGVHDNAGSDYFRWACLICIGYQCVERFAEGHGITITNESFQKWLLKHKDSFAKHDGDVDVLCALSGGYNWITEETKQQ